MSRIIITNEKIDLRRLALGIPWVNDSDGYNMKRPEIAININADPLWIEHLNTEDVQGLFIGCKLCKEAFDRLLSSCVNLQQLYIYDAYGELDNLAFLKNTPYMNQLYICNTAALSDLSPLVDLLNKQAQQRKLIREKPVKSFADLINHDLRDIALINCQIADLSCFEGKDFSILDLNLQDNDIRYITQIRNLRLFNLTLAGNKIEDLDEFLGVQDNLHYLDVRNNPIKDCARLENMSEYMHLYY